MIGKIPAIPRALDDPNTSPSIKKEVIPWLSQKNNSSVPIVENLSPLRPKSRNSSHLRAILMSPSVAPPAAPTAELSVFQAVVPVEAQAAVPARCSPLFAHSAANKQKYRFSLVAINRYTAEIALTRADKPDQDPNKKAGRFSSPCFLFR
jgi:hypothetical protein